MNNIRHIIKNLPFKLVIPLWEMRTYLLHCRGRYLSRRYSGRKNLKINLGCGQNIKINWINIDINKNADLSLDLRRAIPFSSNSCEMIYSEHFLEHLDYPEEATRFLKESLRILMPGGTFSVGIPDTEWPIQAYIEGDNSEYFKYVKERWHPKWCFTRLEHINYHFRQGREHLFAYDFETLKHILERCGFHDITKRNFNPLLDSEERKIGTLYVDAIKPLDK